MSWPKHLQRSVIPEHQIFAPKAHPTRESLNSVSINWMKTVQQHTRTADCIAWHYQVCDPVRNVSSGSAGHNEAARLERCPDLMMMMMIIIILHLFQPHQADQIFDTDRILCMQALTNLATQSSHLAI